MEYLFYLLICAFILLIIYQISLAHFTASASLIEGLENANEYKDYDMNDPNNALILGQQNAGNISYLKIRVDELAGIKAKVDSLQQNVDSMQVQIDGLVQQQADYAQDLAGNKPVEVSGTEEVTTNDIQ